MIAIIADCHCGNHARFGGAMENGLNARARLTIASLQAAVKAAGAAGADTLFVAGDLFHSRRPEPALIAEVQRVFAEADPMLVVVVPGNHDMLDSSAAGGNTACAPLWDEAHVVREPEWHRCLNGKASDFVLSIPYESTVPMALHLARVLEGSLPKCEGKAVPRGRRILVTHVGVWDADSPKWTRGARDGISAPMLFDLMEKMGIGAAFVGNYHEHKIWERNGLTICQVGALCPTGFGDSKPGKHGLMALGDASITKMVAIPGPRFEIVLEKHTEWGVPQDKNTYFVRQVGGVEATGAATEKLGGYEYVPAGDASGFGSSDEEEKQELFAPADDPLAAVVKFAQEMELEDGADRQAVVDLVSDLWKKGA